MEDIKTSHRFGDLLSSKAQSLSLTEVLSQPISALNGISADMTTALAAMDIKTIFDLGTAWVFANARQLLLNCQPGGGFSRLGKVPNNFLDANVAAATPIEKIGELDIKFLLGISDPQAAAIQKSLGVTSVKEFALWQPAEMARLMVAASMGTTIDGTTTEDSAEELRPRFGEYPTSRVYYDSLVMLEMKGTPEVNPPIVDIKTAGGKLSLKSAIDKKGNFAQPAIGALLTFSQSWYAQGITLGQMVHSLGLAPGEVTRIAVIDWNRKTKGSQTEAISEAEKLDSATSHTLAQEEVQNSVANDLESGGSKSSASSKSSSASAAMSVETGLLTSLFASGGASGNVQTASTDSSAASSSWSVGHRDIAASMSKNINDKTEQHSNSARSRRASVVKEVSQSEHEQVSTRVVANYNHMHALTVQYYEVIQVYRTLVQLHQAERCLFLPMEVIDFEDEVVLERYRGILASRALSSTAYDLLIDDTSSVMLKPTIDRSRLFAASGVNIGAVAISPINNKIEQLFASFDSNLTQADTDRVMAFKAQIAPTPIQTMTTKPDVSISSMWQTDVVQAIGRAIGKPILRPNDDRNLYLSDNTFLVRISVQTIQPLQVNVHNITTGNKLLSFGNQSSVSLERPIQLSEIDKIQLSKTKDSSERNGKLILTCALNGYMFDVPVPTTIGNDAGLNDIIIISTDKEDRKKKTIQHLKENTDYYSKIIYQNLDSATLTILFSQYKWGDRSLLEMVDPKPIKVVGNYLVLKAPTDSLENLSNRDTQIERTADIQEWRDLLRKYNIQIGGTANERIVPIPTGGVFAEAVLGRSNAAEKLDITRFWNWQDSPIPILPTDIAPIQTGSRATAEDLKASALGQPVLNIVNPTTLPTGSELGGILSAVSNGNMFRDMSGLAGTQGLVKAGMEGTLQAATDSGQLTSANMKTQAEKAVAMGQIAADLAKSVISAATGVPAGGGGSSVKGISGDGAKINHAKSMDDRGVKNDKNSAGSAGTNSNNTDAGSSNASPTNDGTGGGGSNANGGGGGDNSGSTNTRSFEAEAFDKANWGSVGNSGSSLLSNVLDNNNALAAAPLSDGGAPAPVGVNVRVYTIGDKHSIGTGTCNIEQSEAYKRYLMATFGGDMIIGATSVADLKTQIGGLSIKAISFVGHGTPNGDFILNGSRNAGGSFLAAANAMLTKADINDIIKNQLMGTSSVELRGCWSDQAITDIMSTLKASSKFRSVVVSGVTGLQVIRCENGKLSLDNNNLTTKTYLLGDPLNGL